MKTLIITISILSTASLAGSGELPMARALNRVESSGERLSPKSVVPFTSFNFGDVYTGDLISQLFVIKNIGDTDLQITDFKGDCGCTVVRSEKVIPPGQEGVAEIQVQTVSQSGVISKMATMRTNDPDQPTIVFTLIANVLKGAPFRQGKYIGPVFLSPDSSGAMFAAPGKKAAIEFSITAEQAPVKVLRAEVGSKNFAARVVELEAGKSYKVQVESLPIQKGGIYRDQVTIVTDNPALPPFKIDLSLRVYDSR